jgi:hypothetical protein
MALVLPVAEPAIVRFQSAGVTADFGRVAINLSLGRTRAT